MLTLYCVFGVILPTSGCTLNILHLFNSNRFLHHFPCKYSKDSTLKYHQIKCECIQFLYDPQHTNLIIILNVHLCLLETQITLQHYLSLPYYILPFCMFIMYELYVYTFCLCILYMYYLCALCLFNTYTYYVYVFCMCVMYVYSV